MLRGAIAITQTGMPLQHGRAFQRVANSQNCVIAVRAVGQYATHLLLEGYATKGFHNKAKSCTWGPMAGFVLADPRFTKNPDILSQRKALQGAILSGANEIPLYISDRRRNELENVIRCITLIRGGNEEKLYSAINPSNYLMRFILRKTVTAPGAHGKPLWAVFYAPNEYRLSNHLTQSNKALGENDPLPVMVVVDAYCPKEVRQTYRAATTCDYDLWGVFPKREAYSRLTHDKRRVPDSDRVAQNLSAYNQYEDEHLGNITPRIMNLKDLINREVRACGYLGGDVVHHSDEAGRPLVANIDFPCLFFIPHKLAFCAYGVNDLKQLINELHFEFVLGLNPGWYKQLGFGVSMAGNYEV